MSVDRSYSPYEVIRAYHDRGMMKWGAFATGELTEAQNTFEKKDDKKIQALPHHVVLYLLNQSFCSCRMHSKALFSSLDFPLLLCIYFEKTFTHPVSQNRFILTLL